MINVSIQTQRGRSFGWLLALSVFCMLSITSIRSYGQGSALSAVAVHSNLCPPGFHCCQLLTFTAGVATDALDIQLPFPSTLDPTCWNWGCANNTLAINPTALFDNSTPPKQNGWHFTFNPSLAAGKTIQIMLCPVDGRENCAYAWTSLNWTSFTAGNPPVVIASGTTGISPCQSGANDIMCPSCDRVDLTTPNTCYERLCVTRHWPVSNSTSGNTFTLHIVPALQACNQTSSGGCPVTSIAIDQTEFPGWSASQVNGVDGNGQTYTNLTLSLNPGDLGGCGTVCINIPKCNPAITHTVVVNNPNDGHPCAAVSAAFKTVGGPDPVITAENFPNPLTRANQFKTVIPFEIGQNGGEAKVSVMNDAGKLVYQDVQTFAGSGKHFFYFTGEQLPSGKYFYTIESPIGAVIVKKSLLIVK